VANDNGLDTSSAPGGRQWHHSRRPGSGRRRLRQPGDRKPVLRRRTCRRRDSRLLCRTDFSGNVITRNWIGRSNLRDDTDDTQTTGVYIGDASPLTITVLSNTISDNYYGIFTVGSIKAQVPFLSAL
jgi:hypothetical protein